MVNGFSVLKNVEYIFITANPFFKQCKDKKMRKRTKIFHPEEGFPTITEKSEIMTCIVIYCNANENKNGKVIKLLLKHWQVPSTLRSCFA